MLFSKINLKTSIIILIIFFIGSLFFIKNSFLAVDREIDNLALSQITVAQSRTISNVTYIINFGEETIEEQLFILKDSTVFSLLQDLAQKRNFNIETSYYEGMGVLVESIDMIRNMGGIDDKYWQYWVNDELPMVSADKMELKKDDVVEWKFEPIVF